MRLKTFPLLTSGAFLLPFAIFATLLELWSSSGSSILFQDVGEPWNEVRAAGLMIFLGFLGLKLSRKVGFWEVETENQYDL